jgi:hypothetical protein
MLLLNDRAVKPSQPYFRVSLLLNIQSPLPPKKEHLSRRSSSRFAAML